MNPLTAVAVLLLVSSCAKAPLDNIPLVWKPTSVAAIGVVNLAGIGDTQIHVETFRTAGKQPNLIAENREDPVPKPVTTRDDVGEFVSAHVTEILRNAGLNIVDSNPDIVLSGEVRRFFVDETSTYNGGVALYLVVKNRAGKVLWNGVTAGSARHFGRSYSSENYYETLSDSLVDAIAKILRDPDFHNALAHE